MVSCAYIVRAGMPHVFAMDWSGRRSWSRIMSIMIETGSHGGLGSLEEGFHIVFCRVFHGMFSVHALCRPVTIGFHLFGGRK